MPRRKSTASSLYDVHPGVTMVTKWVAELTEKTGHSLEEWVELVNGAGLQTHKQKCEWLKANYGLGTNYASWIVNRASGNERLDEDPETYLRNAAIYVDETYAGPKAGLRPLHDRLIGLGRSLGPDVRICPCKTIVPFYRKNVFAQIKPTTRTRIDPGLSLRGIDSSGSKNDRLVSTGGEAKNDRITHRIAVQTLTNIDDELKRSLALAYNRAA